MGIKGLKEAYMFSSFPTQFSSWIQLQKTSGKLVYRPKTKSQQSQVYMFSVQNFFEDDFFALTDIFLSWYYCVIKLHYNKFQLDELKHSSLVWKILTMWYFYPLISHGNYQQHFSFFFLTEAVPGNIRQAEHFVNFMRRFIEYLKVCSTLLLPKIFRLISFMLFMYLT